jgi:hypothetical protein
MNSAYRCYLNAVSCFKYGNFESGTYILNYSKRIGKGQYTFETELLHLCCMVTAEIKCSYTVSGNLPNCDETLRSLAFARRRKYKLIVNNLLMY